MDSWNGITPLVVWSCVAVGLILLEILTGTFVLLCFGIAAFGVAIAAAAGIHSLSGQLVFFAAASLATSLLFRKKIREAFSHKKSYANDDDTWLVLSENIAAGATGHAEYQGSIWSALNESDTEMKKGEKVILRKTNSTTLVLRKP